jgi:hypothetical protein
MGTFYHRTYAVGLIVCGVNCIAFPVGLVLFEPKARAEGVESPGKMVLFLAIVCLAGTFLCLRGWSQLRALKKGHPEQTWLQFLGLDSSVVIIGPLTMLGIFLMPPAWRDACVQAFHDLEWNLTLARGGHP